MATRNAPLIKTKTRTIGGLSIRYAESAPREVSAILLSPWPESLFDFLRDVSAGLKEGRIHDREHVVYGLENDEGPRCDMLNGENLGKTWAPHWMILWPSEPKAAGLSTVMRDAGTTVMIAGTPYAHLHICGSPWEGTEYRRGVAVFGR